MKKSVKNKNFSPEPLNPKGFNPKAVLPYGCKTVHIKSAMQDFLDFLTFINIQLKTKKLSRLEDFLMPANFSSVVGEFMCASIPKYAKTLLKNNYHNGHPDLVPKGVFPKDAVLHATEGIEIKASRYLNGWQGHNAEDGWIMVFVFDSNGSRDIHLGVESRSFKFVSVYAADLSKTDWTFAGRSETSRRTITASINKSGFNKLAKNWIYHSSLTP